MVIRLSPVRRGVIRLIFIQFFLERNDLNGRANTKSNTKSNTTGRPDTTDTTDRRRGKAIEDAVAKAKAEWEKDLEQKLMDAENEGARKAKLSADQRKKEEDDKAREDFEKEKAEFEREKIVAYAETELAKVGLSAEIAKYIIAEDKDSTKAVIDKIKESYDKDVQAGVTERLKGKTPNLNGGSGGHNTGSLWT